MSWQDDPVTGAAPAPAWQGDPIVDQPAPESSGVVDRFLNGTSVGRIMDQFGQGMKDGWGTAPPGLSDETEKALRDHGVFNDYSTGRTSIMKSFNEAIVRRAAVSLDDVMRGGNALLAGAGRATGQIANETGLTKVLGNTEDAARRDFEGMAMLAPAALGVANELGVISRAPGAKPGTRFAAAEEQPLGSVAPSAEVTPPAPAVEPTPVRPMATSEGLEPHTLFSDMPAPDKAGNINLDRISAPTDVKDVIRTTAESNGGFMDSRRGTISLAQTEDLADALGMDSATLNTRKIGEAFNAEQITAARTLLVQSATNVRDLASKVMDGNEASLQAFVEAEAKHKAIQEQVAGITAEGGRALNAFKIQAKATKEAQNFSEVLKGLGDSTEDAAARAKAVGDLETPEQVSRFLQDSRKPTFKDQFLEYWINGLLSGPATHTTYAESNALMALWKGGIETPVAGAIGAVRNAVNPAAAADRVFMGETGAQLHGFLKGAQEGIIGGWHALKNNVVDALPGEQQMAPPVGKIPGPIGELIRVPSRVIQGIHGFYRAIGYRQSINALAYRDAMKGGLTGDDFATKLAAIKSNPSEEMMTMARNDSMSMAMMARPEGAFGKRLESMANTNLVTKMVAPFVRVGLNVVDQGLVQRSPLGLMSSEVRKTLMGEYGAAARDTQIARMGVGSALGASVIHLAAQGLVTGGGPSDPREAATLQLTGWRPYSVKIGDTYYGYHRLGSLGQIIGVSADMYDIGHHLESSQAEEIAAMVTDSVAKNMVDETWMRGPAELIQAIQDPDRYGKAYIRNELATLVPFSVGMGQVARSLDPNMRNAQSIIDAVKVKIPFLSQTVRPRYDVWGQPMLNQGSLGPDALSAVYESRVNNDPVNQQLNELGIFPSRPEKKIKGVALSLDQYDEFQMTAGRLAKMSLDNLVQIPGFADMPEFARKEAITREIRATRQTAEGLMQMRHPELIQQGIEARQKQIQGVAK